MKSRGESLHAGIFLFSWPQLLSPHVAVVALIHDVLNEVQIEHYLHFPHHLSNLYLCQQQPIIFST